MVHTFSALGRNLAVDVNSGAVHVLDKLCCDLLSLVSSAISGSPPKKSTSMFRRLPDFSTTQSMARLAVSKSMVMRCPVPKSPVEAKQ